MLNFYIFSVLFAKFMHSATQFSMQNRLFVPGSHRFCREFRPASLHGVAFGVQRQGRIIHRLGLLSGLPGSLLRRVAGQFFVMALAPVAAVVLPGGLLRVQFLVVPFAPVPAVVLAMAVCRSFRPTTTPEGRSSR